MKPLTFLGDSLKRLRDLPADAKQDIGYQLDAVQRGQQPDDFKPLPSIGKGVEEFGCGMSPALTVLFTRLDSQMPYMFCICFKRSHRPRRSET